MGDRRRQCGSEDLPGEEALGDKREGYVDPLAEEVVGPPTDLLVLQPLVDGEAVEENEKREEDRVDEPGRGVAGGPRGQPGRPGWRSTGRCRPGIRSRMARARCLDARIALASSRSRSST